MTAVNGLVRVLITVKQDNCIGCSEVNAQAVNTCCLQENPIIELWYGILRCLIYNLAVRYCHRSVGPQCQGSAGKPQANQGPRH